MSSETVKGHNVDARLAALRYQMPDSQIPDVLCSFFCAGSAFDLRLFFYLKKTDVVGSLWLPTDKALESCSNLKL